MSTAAKPDWRDQFVGTWCFSPFEGKPKKVTKVVATRRTQKSWSFIYGEFGGDTIRWATIDEACKATPEEAVEAYVAAMERQIAEEELEVANAARISRDKVANWRERIERAKASVK